MVTEIPNEAPVHEIPELKITRWITEDGEELTPVEEGTQEPREFDGYTFEGTEVDGGITTHVYHNVVTEIPNDAPKHELPELEIPTVDTPVETPKVETPKVETPKTPEAPKTPVYEKDKLPETGDSTSILPLIGMSILGLVGVGKRRRKE